MVKIESRQDWFAAIPDTLKAELFSTFDQIEKNFRERRWEPSELNAGKLCEVVYSVLRGYVDGDFPAKSYKPANFPDACRAFEREDKLKFSQAIRISIPRMLIAIYEIRNNRGVGHVGGDVNPNEMDASVTLANAKWVLAELLRHFHGVNPIQASEIISSITSRICPLVWEVSGKMRVLVPSMTMKDKVLLLLHSSPGPVHEDHLFDWVEHCKKSMFKRDVLKSLHREKFVELDESSRNVYLSPLGISKVETFLLKDRHVTTRAA